MSLEQNARASESRDRIAQAIEAEIEVLRELRPHLSSRLDRCAGLLVAQISYPPRSRPVRVRIGASGKARFLVNSLTSPGVTYEVDVKTYECSCPDAHRRGKGCKHGLCCYILKRAAREVSSARKPGCGGCDGGWVFIGEQVLDEETGEIVEAHNPIPCRRCRVKPETGEELLTDGQMLEWMNESRWIFAKTYADSHPHSYTLRKHQDPERFDAAARTIWEAGYDRLYLRRPWRTLVVGDYILWLWTRPEGPRMPYPTDTVLVNRTERHRARVA